jgi:hypothetical protein
VDIGLPLILPCQSPQLAEAITKICPDCAEEIKAAAKVCRFCGYRFDGAIGESSKSVNAVSVQPDEGRSVATSSFSPPAPSPQPTARPIPTQVHAVRDKVLTVIGLSAWALAGIGIVVGAAFAHEPSQPGSKAKSNVSAEISQAYGYAVTGCRKDPGASQAAKELDGATGFYICRGGYDAEVYPDGHIVTGGSVPGT